MIIFFKFKWFLLLLKRELSRGKRLRWTTSLKMLATRPITPLPIRELQVRKQILKVTSFLNVSNTDYLGNASRPCFHMTSVHWPKVIDDKEESLDCFFVLKLLGWSTLSNLVIEHLVKLNEEFAVFLGGVAKIKESFNHPPWYTASLALADSLEKLIMLEFVIVLVVYFTLSRGKFNFYKIHDRTGFHSMLLCCCWLGLCSGLQKYKGQNHKNFQEGTLLKIFL